MSDPTPCARRAAAIDWQDVLCRLRQKVKEGADRIEWHIESDVVRGMREVGGPER